MTENKGDLISRSEAEKLGATCLARRNENGQLEAIISLDNAQTVETKTTAECIIAYGDGYETARRLYARPQGEWIPVSERLPEQANQSYLVTVDYGNGLICSCQRFFFGDSIGWNDDCVIAWQPLPEPYKEDMKGKEE